MDAQQWRNDLLNALANGVPLGTKDDSAVQMNAECLRIRESLQRAEQGRNEWQAQLAQWKAIMENRKYTCQICGVETDYETVSSATIMVGSIMITPPLLKPLMVNSLPLYSYPHIENGDVVFAKNAMVVCSESCKRLWVRKNWWKIGLLRTFVLDAVNVPEGIDVFYSLDDLKNDLTDAHGISNRDKLNKVEEMMDDSKGFYFYGDRGSGKTTVAAVLARMYVLDNLHVRWITYQELTEMLDTKYPEVVKARFLYREVEEEFGRVVRKGKPWNVVVIDDLSNDFVENSEPQKRLKQLFSQYYNNGTKLIITSNVDKQTMGNAISPMIHDRWIETTVTVKFPQVFYRQMEKKPKLVDVVV